MALKPEFIEANTLNDAWFLTLYKCIDEGRVHKITRGSFEGQKRLEFDHIVVHIKNPGLGGLVPEIPEHYKVDPPCDPDYVEDYTRRYLMGHELAENESYTYGQRITKYPVSHPIDYFKEQGYDKILIQEIDVLKELGIIITETEEVKAVNRQGDEEVVETKTNYFINQIELVIWLYNNKGHRNNQTVLQIAHPEDLLLQDPPCLRHIQVRIQEDKVHFFVYFRSWDLYNGFPANLAAIQNLKVYMSEMITDVEDGEIIATSGGLHIYDYAFDLAKMLSMKDEVMLKIGDGVDSEEG